MSRLRIILVVTAGLVLIASSAAHSLLIPGVLLTTGALLPSR